MAEMEKAIESIRAASKEVSRQLKTLMDANDLDPLKHLQLLILGRLQDSNAVIAHFNDYSENCFAEVSSDFSRNTRMLKSMKSDLDYIFLKLRGMKAKIMATYQMQKLWKKNRMSKMSSSPVAIIICTSAMAACYDIYLCVGCICK